MTRYSQLRVEWFWCLAVLVASAAARPAQSQGRVIAEVRGVTRDAESGAPLPGVSVTATGARPLVTDANGRFAFRDIVSAQRVTIRARRIGYGTVDTVIAVPPGGVNELVLRMTARAQRLDSVLSSARPPERASFEDTPNVGEVTISGATLTRVPSVGEPDVLRVAQLMPGVLAKSDYTAGYNVRGGESDQNLVLLDGIPVYNPFHLGGLFGTFIDATVREVSLLTGGFPAQYGGRLSSVLDVTPAAERRPGVHGTAGLSMLSSSLVLGGSLFDRRTSWNLGARRTYADKVASLVSDRQLPYYFQDGQLHVQRTLGTGGSVSLTGYAGQDVLDGSFADFDPDEASAGAGNYAFKWGNALGGVTLRQPLGANPLFPLGNGRFFSLGDSAIFTQRVSVTRFNSELDLGNGSFVLANKVNELRAAGSFGWFSSTHSPQFGYEYSKYLVDYGSTSDQTGIALFDLRQKAEAGALFIEDLWRINKRFLLRAGVRGEYVKDAQWIGASPRFSLRYFASDDLAFTIAGGQYAQWMHALRDENVPIRVFDFWIASDEFVPVSVAQHAVLGVERWFGAARFVRVETYVKEYGKLNEVDPTDDLLVRGDEFRPLEGRSYGADVLLRQLEGGPLSGWLAYSFGVSTRQRAGIVEGERIEFSPAQDRRHNLNVVALYRPGSGRYTFSGRVGLGTGTPYSDIIGQVVRRIPSADGQSWDLGVVRRNLEPVAGAYNGSRYPLFQRLDLSVSRRFTRGRVSMEPYLQVVNAYNAQNVFVYTFDYTSNPPTRKAFSQFPILPTIGLTVAW